MPNPAAAQDVELPTRNSDVRALASARDWLLFSSIHLRVGPISPKKQAPSPDADTLTVLDETSFSAGIALRAAIDLYSVYENLKNDSDRAMLKPMLLDRLRLCAHLMDVYADSASHALGEVKQKATKKRSLELQEKLQFAKGKLDALIAALTSAPGGN